MKKPAASKRDNPEDPELDEFSKLQQQYDEASAEERERLWPDLIRAIREIDPCFLQKFERAFRSGEYLKAQVESAIKRALARADLRPGGKTNAKEEATAVHFILNELAREDLSVGEFKELAYELGTRTLFIGQWAGPSHNEVENLQARFMSARQQRLGKKRKKDKPKVAHAKELTCEIAEENSELSAVDIAEEIPNRWRLTDVAYPEHDRLVRLVRKWRRDGVIPPQTGPRRRRKYPLQRASSKLKFPKD
jgi:hypothetical protein